jgi:hypothetical protein
MKTAWLLLASAALVAPVFAAPDASPFAGRWDLTVKTPTDTYPSWLEVTPTSDGADVRIVGRVSSVHPATGVKLTGSHLMFTSSEWFDKPTKVDWDITVRAGKLSGTQKRETGVVGKLTGVPAPKLDRPAPVAWTMPQPLFNGKNLDGWVPDDPANNHYVAINNELVNEKPGANIRTTRQFQDFKLHIEYNCPEDGNSGVYLRGRYEIQVAYEAPGKNDKFHGMGSLYGFLAPEVEIPPRVGQWESYDVTLIGRTATLIRDGQTIIDNKEIPGITGGALNSHEAMPGPIYIQGDHTGGMKYRNITISVPER